MNEGLVAFLYLLMRDELVCGRVAGMVAELNRIGDRDMLGEDHCQVIFTNKHMEAYAREMAQRITELPISASL